MTRKELKKMFVHLTSEEIAYRVRTSTYKTEKGLLSHLTKLNEQRRAEKEQLRPTYICIELTWHKSRTWGWCPSAEMWWRDEDGSHHIERSGYASGYGYDKGSSAVAESLNKILKGVLYRAMRHNSKKAPYGLHKYWGGEYVEGGIGLNCHYAIAEYLGYKFEKREGKSWDILEWTSKRKG